MEIAAHAGLLSDAEHFEGHTKTAYFRIQKYADKAAQD